MKSLLKRIIVSVVLVLLLLLGSASHHPAHALGEDLICTGTDTSTYSPPLTNTSRSETISNFANLTYCEVHSDSGITAGTDSSTITIVTSCTTLSFPAHTTSYVWDNGQMSVVNYTTTIVTRVNGTIQVQAIGKVVSGGFVGDNATETATLPALDLLECAGSGVPSLTGPETVEFTSL